MARPPADGPERAEVLAWMRRTGGTQLDAIGHFWPSTSAAERDRIRMRVRKWVQREGRPDPRPPLAPAPVPARVPSQEPVPRPSVAVSHLPLLDFLARVVDDLAADLEVARASGRGDLVARLVAQMVEARNQLEQERTKAASAVRIDRTPAAIAAEVERHARLIALKAEQDRRRAAAEAAKTARDRDL